MPPSPTASDRQTPEPPSRHHHHHGPWPSHPPTLASRLDQPRYYVITCPVCHPPNQVAACPPRWRDPLTSTLPPTVRTQRVPSLNRQTEEKKGPSIVSSRRADAGTESTTHPLRLRSRASLCPPIAHCAAAPISRPGHRYPLPDHAEPRASKRVVLSLNETRTSPVT